MLEKKLIKEIELKKLEIILKFEFILNNENELKKVNYYFYNEKIENEKLLKNLSIYLKNETNLNLNEITNFYYEILKETL